MDAAACWWCRSRAISSLVRPSWVSGTELAGDAMAAGGRGPFLYVFVSVPGSECAGVY